MSEACSDAVTPRAEPGGQRLSLEAPASMCQVCRTSLDDPAMPAFFKRYRVCKQHASMPMLERGGVPSRFCQQCGRFHVLPAFDGTQRSCRAQLAAHAARRRRRRQRSKGPGGSASSEGECAAPQVPAGVTPELAEPCSGARLAGQQRGGAPPSGGAGRGSGALCNGTAAAAAVPAGRQQPEAAQQAQQLADQWCPLAHLAAAAGQHQQQQQGAESESGALDVQAQWQRITGSWEQAAEQSLGQVCSLAGVGTMPSQHSGLSMLSSDSTALPQWHCWQQDSPTASRVAPVPAAAQALAFAQTQHSLTLGTPGLQWAAAAGHLHPPAQQGGLPAVPAAAPQLPSWGHKRSRHAELASECGTPAPHARRLAVHPAPVPQPASSATAVAAALRQLELQWQQDSASLRKRFIAQQASVLQPSLLLAPAPPYARPAFQPAPWGSPTSPGSPLAQLPSPTLPMLPYSPGMMAQQHGAWLAVPPAAAPVHAHFNGQQLHQLAAMLLQSSVAQHTQQALADLTVPQQY